MITPKLRFTTEPELYGVIPEPIPARHALPEWFKKLPNYTNKGKEKTNWPGRTIKRCPPFLDALSTGYIIGTPAEIEIRVSMDGRVVDWKTDFLRPVIEAHSQEQVTGNPSFPKPPLKFLNYWALQTPKGWSTLFVNPLNRNNDIIDAMSGIVETDKYYEYINFPSFLKVKGTTFILPRGYPIVQAIPFKRGLEKKAIIESMNNKDLANLKKTRDRRTSQPSLYRDTMWEQK